MKQWEYRVEVIEASEYRDGPTLQEGLNQLGGDGWELAATVRLDDGDGEREFLILKRTN